MKKKLLALCLLLVASVGAVGGGYAAFADVSCEQCDLCFRETVNGILEEDEINGSYVLADRVPLYDLKLENMGYVYSFQTSYGEGFAIVICDNGEYVTREFVKSSPNPYATVGEDELCVYAQTMTYLKAVRGAICDVQSSIPLTEEALAELEKTAVFYQSDGSATSEHKTVRIDYVSKSYDNNALCWAPPVYYNVGWSGGCAAVAGGNLVGYYDRYYEDLIPNHAAGYEGYGRYIYNFADDYVNEAITTLYSDMNGDETGITETNFKNGLQKYCLRKGLSCDFTSLKSGGSLSYDTVKNCINSGYPIALLLNTFNVCSTYESNTYTNIYYNLYYANHVMVGYGYRNITFTHSDGSTSQCKFINVITGWNDPATAYFNMEYCTNIISAYKVNIY